MSDILRIDLNCDLGESYGAFKVGMDEEVIPFVTSVNVACGYHAGDPLVMDKTVAAAKAAGVAVGAHPGYPDLMGFGRRNLVCTPAEAKAYVQYQMGALLAFCAAHGVPLQHVKPHGALYNMAAKDEALAAGIAEGIASVDKNVILLDDMIDTAGTICAAADKMMEQGALSVRVFASHGVLSGLAYENIEKSAVKDVVIIDSIPLKQQSEKIKVLSVADMFAETIACVYNHETITKHFLFRK